VSMREVLDQILQRQDPAVKKVIFDVLVAEQEKIDMHTPQGIYRDIHKAIDDQVRREERGR
jgi:hypothetical protein